MLSFSQDRNDNILAIFVDIVALFFFRIAEKGSNIQFF